MPNRFPNLSAPTRTAFVATVAALAAGWLAGPLRGKASAAYEVVHSDAEWRKLLTPEQYYVLRQSGTETPFSSPLDKETRPGTYYCAGCRQALYDSSMKYDSGTGWPSFFRVLPGAIGKTPVPEMFGQAEEVHCSRCGGHLGHVFDDGPKPTGLRYCMDGVALVFVPRA